MSQTAREAVRAAMDESRDAFFRWMMREGLEFDGNSNLRASDGTLYSTDDDYERGITLEQREAINASYK
tara:strand:- start:1089 stop:1295 length:207 start_codon:yes stop_codon:yes gene_type:complete